MTLKYKRVLLKISGEALCGGEGFGIKPNIIQEIALEIKEVHELGAQISIVVGGGNIFRGATAAKEHGMDRVTGDQIGMLATIINGLALQSALERNGVDTRVLTAIDMRQFAEPYVRRRALRHINKGRVVILAGGTGNPYFSTDTAASLRAMEMNSEVIIKATKVDGVYDDDPETNKNAIKFDKIKHIDALKMGLKVMDATAISLCMDNNMPIIVCNLKKRGNIKSVMMGEQIGTIVE